MPFNGTGTFSAPVVTGWPAVSGNVISSTAVNTVIEDIHTGLSSVLPRDGQAAMTGDLDLGANDLLNAANGDFSGTLGVDGAVTLGSTVAITGAVTAAATITAEGYAAEHSDLGNSSTAKTVDWSDYRVAKLTLTANCTLTFTAPTAHSMVMLKLHQDGTGSRTVTWPASVKWANGAAPTLTTTASGIDMISFYYDGTNYFGAAALAFA